MKCVICQGELVVLRATTSLEENGWLCQCQGSCKVLQVLTDEELYELGEEPQNMTLRDEYLRRSFGSPAMAAARFAKDLTRDDPTTLKVGYSIEDAILAAAELFPEAPERSIRRLNEWESE